MLIIGDQGDVKVYKDVVLLFGLIASFILMVSLMNVMSLMTNKILKSRQSNVLLLSLGLRKMDLRKQFLLERLLVNLSGLILGLFFAKICSLVTVNKEIWALGAFTIQRKIVLLSSILSISLYFLFNCIQ